MLMSTRATCVLKIVRALAMRMGLVICVCCSAPHAWADWKDDIGYTQLVSTLNSLGMTVPNGSGVPISMVEAGGSNNLNYWVDTSSPEFNAASDPLGTAVVFIDGSNQASKVVSSHANSQARTIFGNSSSIAPAANQVTIYEAGLYLANVLHAPNGSSPAIQNFRVQNSSWIGSYDTTPLTPSTPQETADDVSALRRFDFMINRDNVTAFVGLANSLTPLPTLLGQSYNSLAVGCTDGEHSTGLTSLVNYGAGRSKPDLVSPFTTSSAATSSASSAATLLHSVVAGTDAANSKTMKAILMAGATKNEFLSWSRTTTQPLDDTFGAGEINVFNSYLMTMGGRYAGSTAPSSAVGSHGWDYQTVSPGPENELKYNFVVPTGSTAPELSILLTWNVDVSSNFTGQVLANLDLKLTDSTGQIVDQSLSTVDNVEHIYLQNLAAGDYTLSISTDTSRDFGLAWRMSTLAEVESADFDADGDVDGRDFVAWQRGFGKLINATHAEGDANGDGDVDQDDLLVYQAQYLDPVPEVPPLLAAYAVPEPATLAFAASGVLVLLLGHRKFCSMIAAVGSRRLSL